MNSYGENKKVCYLIESFKSDTCPFDNNLEIIFIKNIFKILEQDKNLLIFVVARRKEQLDILVKELNNYEKYKNRIIFDNYFSTYEFLSYCDYLITGSTSSALFEATKIKISQYSHQCSRHY